MRSPGSLAATRLGTIQQIAGRKRSSENRSVVHQSDIVRISRDRHRAYDVKRGRVEYQYVLSPRSGHRAAGLGPIECEVTGEVRFRIIRLESDGSPQGPVRWVDAV